MTKQTTDHFTIRSVSDGSARDLRWGPMDQIWTKQPTDHFTIRSVSDGSARGLGPRAD